MRQICFDEFGEPADALRLADVDLGEPGPGEVRLRTVMAPIHPADLAFIRGRYVQPESLPACPGIEGLGVVEAVGPDVSGITTGGRYLVTRQRGAWADGRIVPAENLLPVPEGISDEIACQLFINPLTAALLLDCVTAPGAVVQTAAGSAVGRLIIQMAKTSGRRVINVVRHEETARDLKAQGADTVILSAAEDWPEKVRAAAAGEPIVAALDPVAGDTAVKLLSTLSKGGRLILYGALSGEPVPVNAMLLAGNDLSVRGFWLAQVEPERERQLFADVAARFAEGALTIPTAGIFALDDFKDAVRAAEAPGKLGSVLLKA